MSASEDQGAAVPNRGERTDLPASNTDYSRKEYWDSRFKEEPTYDWLAGFKDIEALLQELAPRGTDSRILLVGCGNSTLTTDMYAAGYRNLVSTDFSEVVIQVMDMTALTYKDTSFDMVLDKAAMDAITTAEGDVWAPDQHVIDAVHRMCAGVARVLVPGGVFAQVSFVQPHFRRKYLEGTHAGAQYGWRCATREVAGKVMPHFCYVMTKDGGAGGGGGAA